MKMKVEYTNEMIKKLIIKDLNDKVNFSSHDIKNDSFDIKVRSKQNYREKDFEIGELKVELEIEI